MVLLRDMTPTELLSASLYMLTAILLIYAVGERYRLSGRFCAAAAIVTVIAANSFLLLSYSGEPAVAYERPRPIKRIGGERGSVAFEGDGLQPGADPTEAASGAGSTVTASAEPHGAGRAERALMRLAGDCPACPEMVVVPPGVFRVGASPDDAAATASEHPTRLIGIAKPFAIGRDEVTIAEYAAFAKATRRSMPACPDYTEVEERGKLPMTCVSATDADAYAQWLAARTGRPFRLPSEAEWEYAARAGATGPFANGRRLAPGNANIGRSQHLTVRVGSYPANAFGLNDMHGNAAEIVGGCWTASPSLLPGDGRPASETGGCKSRVLRDAHAGEPVDMARLSARRPIDAAKRSPGVGFRLARDLK
jgi:formylglycine-generating enzyme required for sulfatase activity